MRTSRREFTAALAGAFLSPRSASTAETAFTVLLDEPIGIINPNIYGHFAENIGGVIYDGIWVGRHSNIPNYEGIRKELVDAFKKLNPPVVRWPGGCFADSYDWRDGIGPSATRPTRTNFWINDPALRNAPDGPQKFDPNAFGTHEFAQFCRLSGAKPYLAANLRSLTAKDFYQWVEYCNAPENKTTLARKRAANGDPGPFHVRFWGVGNEAWGCGGDFRPEEYAEEFRRFASWVPDYGVDLALIASGPNGDDVNWTRRFFQSLAEYDKDALKNMYGWSTHYYCGTAGKGDAVDFTEQDWYELLTKAIRMEQIIEDHWHAMSEIDREHRVKLVIDEWGAWHKRGSEIDPTYLFGQMPTMRDALISALTLDIFNRHADKIAMANVAQLVNNLHCLFLARHEQFLRTPNYHVFAMYAAHQGAQSLRVEVNSEKIAGNLPMLAGSASLHEKQLVLSIVNSSASEPQATPIRIRGGMVRNAQVTVLASADIHAHNTFAEPHTVSPENHALSVTGREFIYQAPAASVSLLRLELA